MSLTVHQIAVGGYDANFAYLISDDKTKHALVVDPSGDLEAILAVADQAELDIVGILITHTHPDHIDQLAELLRLYAVPVYVQEVGTDTIISPGPIIALHDNDTVPLGPYSIKVIHTPGHIDDAVCFYIEETEARDGIPKLISGDTLFVEGCGRTNERRVKDLYESLQELKHLPEGTVVYPGHDYGSKPQSTIGHEKQHNQYMTAKNFTEFKDRRL